MPEHEEGLAERALATHRDRGKRVGKGLPLRKWLSKTCSLQKACKLPRCTQAEEPSSQLRPASLSQKPGSLTAFLTV